MKIILSHRTALRFWRAFRGRVLKRMTAVEQRAFLRAMSKEGAPGQDVRKMLSELGLPGVEEPFHLMVTEKSKCRKLEGIEVHLLTSDLPEGSLVLLTPEIAICSPELAFVQFANATKSVLRTSMLGYELCGTYRFEERTRTFDFEEIVPVLEADRLRSFLMVLSGVAGLRTARSAAALVADSSASPMETSVTLLLCLPQWRGGYAAPFPELNYEIPRSNGPDEFGRYSYRCDLCWPDQKVCIEYDSDYAHGSLEQMAQDAAKRAALTAMGYSVLEVTRAQIMDEKAFEEVAQALFNKLHCRLQVRVDGFDQKKRALRKETLHSFSEYQ